MFDLSAATVVTLPLAALGGFSLASWLFMRVPYRANFAVYKETVNGVTMFDCSVTLRKKNEMVGAIKELHLYISIKT